MSNLIKIANDLGSFILKCILYEKTGAVDTRIIEMVVASWRYLFQMNGLMHPTIEIMFFAVRK